MIHKMRLVDFAFEKMKNKEKDIEVRLNDEKRRLIKIGDIIEFTNIDTLEILKVKVINIYNFKTFEELFNTLGHKRLGLKDEDDASIMNNFYTKDEEKKYGAIGIEIKLLNRSL